MLGQSRCPDLFARAELVGRFSSALGYIDCSFHTENKEINRARWLSAELLRDGGYHCIGFYDGPSNLKA